MSNPANTERSHGLKYILVGASGSGKTTMARILEQECSLRRCITSTTRPPRPGEVDGVDYYFVPEINPSDMFEYTSFGSYDYGIRKDELAKGDFIILDPHGVSFYRDHYPFPLTVIKLERQGIQVDQARRDRDKDAGFQDVEADIVVRGETVSEMAEHLLAAIGKKEVAAVEGTGKIIPTYIDGQPYHVRLPTGGYHPGVSSEWDTMLDIVGEKNPLMHTKNILSWCQDTAYGYPDRHVYRGWVSFTYRHWNNTHAKSRYIHVGYRPVFEPLDPATLKPDPSRIAHIPDKTVFQLGSLYVNDSAREFPSDPSWCGDIPECMIGDQFRIGDTDPDPRKQLQVVKCGGLLWVDRNLVTNISWEELNRQGLVFGDKNDLALDEYSRRPSIDYLIQDAKAENKQQSGYAMASELSKQMRFNIQTDSKGKNDSADVLER